MILDTNGLSAMADGDPNLERHLQSVIANCRVLTVDAGTAGQYADLRAQLKRKGRRYPAMTYGSRR